MGVIEMLDPLQVFAHLEAQERVREQFDPAARGPTRTLRPSALPTGAVRGPELWCGSGNWPIAWNGETPAQLDPYRNLAGVERGERCSTGKLIDCDLDSVRNEPGWETVHADCLAMTQGASALPSCSSSDSFWSRN